MRLSQRVARHHRRARAARVRQLRYPGAMEPSVEIGMPDGTLQIVGPDAIVGRSSVAAVRIDDPRVSTVHAELSWREGGFVLIARGGRLRVGGRAVGEVLLSEGLPVELAPGVALLVGRIADGPAEVVPRTAGRERLRIVLTDGSADVYRGASWDPAVRLTGVGARCFAELVGADAPLRWDQVAEAVWPDEGVIRAATREADRPGANGWTAIDERRLRNRWDQALRALRLALEPLGREGLIEVAGGTVSARLSPGDLVERQGQ